MRIESSVDKPIGNVIAAVVEHLLPPFKNVGQYSQTPLKGTRFLDR